MRYLVIDLANTYFRAIHAAHRGASMEERAAFALHTAIQSIGAAWRDQKADHAVLALEGRSWRKDFYAPYKATRAIKRAAATEQEKAEAELHFAMLAELVALFVNKTNVTTLQHPELEADDLIAGWIQSHPLDHHTIISSDTDYYQLLSSNVNQYNGVSQELHTITGIFDKKGSPVIDKKTKQPKKIPDPGFILFEKCMRGDPTDNIFSAYPGVRTKGTKNKVGLLEAYADKATKGFSWNNLMLQTWTDHDGVEHRVLDDYNRNVTLVDLSAQPDRIKTIIATTIAENAVKKSVSMVGAHFLKFCGKHQLIKLSEQATVYSVILSASYPEKELVS